MDIENIKKAKELFDEYAELKMVLNDAKSRSAEFYVKIASENVIELESMKADFIRMLDNRLAKIEGEIKDL